jgi:hypothetical protein
VLDEVAKRTEEKKARRYKRGVEKFLDEHPEMKPDIIAAVKDQTYSLPTIWGVMRDNGYTLTYSSLKDWSHKYRDA